MVGFIFFIGIKLILWYKNTFYPAPQFV